MEEELEYSKYDYRNKETDNSRNGYWCAARPKRRVLAVDCTEASNKPFCHMILKKRLISMYAKGMSTGNIETHVKDIYEIEMSDSTISRIIDKVLRLV